MEPREVPLSEIMAKISEHNNYCTCDKLQQNGKLIRNVEEVTGQLFYSNEFCSKEELTSKFEIIQAVRNLKKRADECDLERDKECDRIEISRYSLEILNQSSPPILKLNVKDVRIALMSDRTPDFLDLFGKSKDNTVIRYNNPNGYSMVHSGDILFDGSKKLYHYITFKQIDDDVVIGVSSYHSHRLVSYDKANPVYIIFDMKNNKAWIIPIKFIEASMGRDVDKINSTTNLTCHTRGESMYITHHLCDESWHNNQCNNLLFDAFLDKIDRGISLIEIIINGVEDHDEPGGVPEQEVVGIPMFRNIFSGLEPEPELEIATFDVIMNDKPMDPDTTYFVVRGGHYVLMRNNEIIGEIPPEFENVKPNLPVFIPKKVRATGLGSYVLPRWGCHEIRPGVVYFDHNQLPEIVLDKKFNGNFDIKFNGIFVVYITEKDPIKEKLQALKGKKTSKEKYKEIKELKKELMKFLSKIDFSYFARFCGSKSTLYVEFAGGSIYYLNGQTKTLNLLDPIIEYPINPFEIVCINRNIEIDGEIKTLDEIKVLIVENLKSKPEDEFRVFLNNLIYQMSRKGYDIDTFSKEIKVIIASAQNKDFDKIKEEHKLTHKEHKLKYELFFDEKITQEEYDKIKHKWDKIKQEFKKKKTEIENLVEKIHKIISNSLPFGDSIELSELTSKQSDKIDKIKNNIELKDKILKGELIIDDLEDKNLEASTGFLFKLRKNPDLLTFEVEHNYRFNKIDDLDLLPFMDGIMCDFKDDKYILLCELIYKGIPFDPFTVENAGVFKNEIIDGPLLGVLKMLMRHVVCNIFLERETIGEGSIDAGFLVIDILQLYLEEVCTIKTEFTTKAAKQPFTLILAILAAGKHVFHPSCLYLLFFNDINFTNSVDDLVKETKDLQNGKSIKNELKRIFTTFIRFFHITEWNELTFLQNIIKYLSRPLVMKVVLFCQNITEDKKKKNKEIKTSKSKNCKELKAFLFLWFIFNEYTFNKILVKEIIEEYGMTLLFDIDIDLVQIQKNIEIMIIDTSTKHDSNLFTLVEFYKKYKEPTDITDRPFMNVIMRKMYKINAPCKLLLYFDIITSRKLKDYIEHKTIEIMKLINLENGHFLLSCPRKSKKDGGGIIKLHEIGSKHSHWKCLTGVDKVNAKNDERRIIENAKNSLLRSLINFYAIIKKPFNIKLYIDKIEADSKTFKPKDDITKIFDTKAKTATEPEPEPEAEPEPEEKTLGNTHVKETEIILEELLLTYKGDIEDNKWIESQLMCIGLTIGNILEVIGDFTVNEYALPSKDGLPIVNKVAMEIVAKFLSNGRSLGDAAASPELLEDV